MNQASGNLLIAKFAIILIRQSRLSSGFSFLNIDFLDDISGTNLVDHIKTFHHFSKTCMNTIEVSSIRTTVTNKKLGATGITTCPELRN